MNFEVKVEGLDGLIAGLKEVGGNATPLIKAAMLASATKVQEIAREKAPHKTGTLQRSILMEAQGPMGYIVKVNEKYGLYIEEGTRAYDMYPRNKKALFWPGAAHPVRKVHMPARKARPFFEPAIHEAIPFIHSQLQVVGKTITRNIAAASRRK